MKILSLRCLEAYIRHITHPNLVLKKAEMTDNNSEKIRNKYFHKNIINQYIELINQVTS